MLGIPDVRPRIHQPIHDKSRKILTQIRIRKRSSHVERNKIDKSNNLINYDCGDDDDDDDDDYKG